MQMSVRSRTSDHPARSREVLARMKVHVLRSTNKSQDFTSLLPTPPVMHHRRPQRHSPTFLPKLQFTNVGVSSYSNPWNACVHILLGNVTPGQVAGGRGVQGRGPRCRDYAPVRGTRAGDGEGGLRSETFARGPGENCAVPKSTAALETDTIRRESWAPTHSVNRPLAPS